MTDAMITPEDFKKLKPCPKCGNTGPSFYCNNGIYHLHCGRYNCDLAFMIMAANKESAIQEWNGLK